MSTKNQNQQNSKQKDKNIRKRKQVMQTDGSKDTKQNKYADIKSSSEKEFRLQMIRKLSDSKLSEPELNTTITIKDTSLKDIKNIDDKISYIKNIKKVEKMAIKLYTMYGSNMGSNLISNITKFYLTGKEIIITKDLVHNLQAFIALYIKKLIGYDAVGYIKKNIGTSGIIKSNDKLLDEFDEDDRDILMKTVKYAHPSVVNLLQKLHKHGQGYGQGNDDFVLGRDFYIIERLHKAIINQQYPVITKNIIDAYTMGGLRILIDSIRFAIYESPTANSDGYFTVFRGIKTDLDMFEQRGIRHAYPGHFISTSIKLEVALQFKHSNILYIISVPHRAKFLYLEPITESKKEYEILLPDSTEFKIKKYIKNATILYNSNNYSNTTIYYLDVIKQYNKII